MRVCSGEIGIIGGSGLDDPKILSDPKEVAVNTEYGKPSSSFVRGVLNGVEVFISKTLKGSFYLVYRIKL